MCCVPFALTPCLCSLSRAEPVLFVFGSGATPEEVGEHTAERVLAKLREGHMTPGDILILTTTVEGNHSRITRAVKAACNRLSEEGLPIAVSTAEKSPSFQSDRRVLVCNTTRCGYLANIPSGLSGPSGF